jgi:hypothetical protein
LSNTNESATIVKVEKICNLNKAKILKSEPYRYSTGQAAATSLRPSVVPQPHSRLRTNGTLLFNATINFLYFKILRASLYCCCSSHVGSQPHLYSLFFGWIQNYKHIKYLKMLLTVVKWHSLGDALNLAHNASISAVTLSNNIPR